MIAKKRGLDGITQQVLLRLEHGKTKNPEPEILRGVSHLYGVAYEDLVVRCVEAQFGVELRPAKPGEPKPEAHIVPALDPKEEALLGLLRAIPDKGRRLDLMRLMANAAAGLLAEGTSAIGGADHAAVVGTGRARVLPMGGKKPRRK